LKIVIEAIAVRSKQLIQFALTRVTERRMTNVVYERERFRKISIEIESPRDSSRDLRDLERVRQPIAEMIRVARRENLRLCLESAESARMNYAIAIACVVVAIGMSGLRITATAGGTHVHRIWS